VLVERDETLTPALQRRWRDLRIDVPLQILRHEGDLATSIAGYTAALAATSDVTVIVPRPAHMGLLERLRRDRTEMLIARALAPYERVRVTLVRDHEDPGFGSEESGHERLRLARRGLHDVIVLVDHPDRAAMRAVHYALSLGADEVRAVHAAVDPDVQDQLIARWMELRVPIELDLVECWDRNVARALEGFMVDRMRPAGEITVVIPRREFATFRQRLLHDRTSRKIAKALGRYGHVDLAVVPYHFTKRAPADLPDEAAAAPSSGR
jgi:hypothetical protein